MIPINVCSIINILLLQLIPSVLYMPNAGCGDQLKMQNYPAGHNKVYSTSIGMYIQKYNIMYHMYTIGSRCNW